MIYDLSRCITNENDLRHLAIKGLKLQGFSIDTKLHDKHDSINEAALQVLNEWKNKNPDPFQAYDALCDALTNAGMRGLIWEVLKI